MNNNEKRTDILRKIRDALVEICIDIARIIFFWIPGGDEAYGRALMTIHPFIMLIIVAGFFIIKAGNPMRILILMMAIIVVASQWLLGGCIITRAEQKLTGSRQTIIDPFLMIAGITPDRNTRIAATLSMSTTILCIFIWNILIDTFYK